MVHLAVDGGRVFAATELGDHAVLDMGIFAEDYCALMREVWHAVPVVWEDGRARVEAPPEGHPCRADGTTR